MSEYYPDDWVVIRVPDIKNDRRPFYRVLAGWSGGWARADAWRMNSGIVRVEEDDNCYKFFGASGSVYYCSKRSYRLSLSTSDVYNHYKLHWKDDFVLMPEDTNWHELKYE